MTETGRETAVTAQSAVPTPSWLARLGGLAPIAPGLRLVIAFTLTGTVAGLTVVALAKALDDLSGPLRHALLCLFVGPLVWKGARNFLAAAATLAIAILVASALELSQYSFKWILFCSVVIAVGRGFNQPGMRALPPIIGGFSAGWGLISWFEIGSIDIFSVRVLPIVAPGFWAAAGCGDWFSSAIASRGRRRGTEQQLEAKDRVSTFVAWVRGRSWESLPLTTWLAFGVAFGVEAILFFTGRAQSTLDKLAVDAVIVACFLLVARGNTLFGSALLFLVPLGVESISDNDHELALSVAFVPVYLWGMLYNWPLRKAITTTAGIILGAMLLYVVAFFLPESVKTGGVGIFDRFLGNASARVLMVTLLAVLLQCYIGAIDALRDWFAAEGDDRIPAPLAEMDGLAPGDIGLLQARILLSSTTVRVLGMGIFILAALFPFSVMRRSSKHDSSRSTSGDARSALVVNTVAYLNFRKERIEYQVAISRNVTLGEFMSVTGRRPPFGNYDEASPVLLSSGWFGISLDAVREYCDELSRIERLRPCFDTINSLVDPDCNGYRLPTKEEWNGLVALVKSGAYGPLVNDVHHGPHEFVWTSDGTPESFSWTYHAMSCGWTTATDPVPDCTEGIDDTRFRVVRTLKRN